MKDIELIEAAKAAASYSYSPYSGCKVGAALLCENGEIVTGCNIENSSFSPTICAERVAFAKAISTGIRGFTAIAVCGMKNDKVIDDFTPCGVCRQIMREFCKDDFRIIVAGVNGYRSYTLSQLLPHSFGKDKVTG